MTRPNSIVRLREIDEQTNRRVKERFPSDLDASVRDLDSDSSYFWTARVWDVSSTGISFLLKEEIKAETMLEVEVLRDEAVARRLLARVVHATRHSGGTWIIGCDLDRRLDGDELRNLVAD